MYLPVNNIFNSGLKEVTGNNTNPFSWRTLELAAWTYDWYPLYGPDEEGRRQHFPKHRDKRLERHQAEMRASLEWTFCRMLKRHHADAGIVQSKLERALALLGKKCSLPSLS